uniref:CUB domain-containing protein n=1 Tax=Strongyloides venezuelensis TaxID=75913 RepID=A0A0K0FSH8_STRVS
MNLIKVLVLIFWLVLRLSLGGSNDEKLCQCSPIEYSRDVVHDVFKSNGFPKNYCNNQDCIYEIEGRNNSVIIVNVEHFDIEPTHDYVEIFHTQYFNGEHVKVKGQILSGSGHAAKQIRSSIGGGLMFLFHTDNSESDYAGFRMSFTRVDQTKNSNDGCKLPFIFVNSTEEKNIPLPRVKYTTETTCIYQFNSSKHIELSVKKLSAGMDVKVYETENFDSKNPERSKLFAYSYFTLAINDSIKTIQSRTNSLTLIVHIIGARNDIGEGDLMITYKETENPCKCPESEIVMERGEERLYLSPGFPGSYCDNLNCTTNFKIKEATKNDNHFMITFNKFDMEKEMDYVSFMIGDKSLVKFSDINKGSQLKKFTFKREMPVIKTVSDHSITMEGYNLTVKALNDEGSCECYNMKQLETINSIIGDLTMVIDKDCKYIDCFINITQDEFKERHKVNLAITTNIGDGEFMEISSGENNAHNIDTYHLNGFTSLQKRRNEYFFENAQNVFVWYHREKPFMSSEATINIQYNFNVLCACPPEVLSASVGTWKTLTSPDYPQHYCNDLTCRHLIEAPPGYRVMVNVTDVSTEMNHDKVVLFDGDNINTTHIELFSGLVTMSDLIWSRNSQMTVLFESDTSITGKGYSLLYSADKIPDNKGSHSGNSVKNFLIWLLIIITFIIIGYFSYVYYKNKTFPYTSPITYQNFGRPEPILRFRNINHSEPRTNLI